MREKYLLIGDHRTCENYGSIATSEMLLELLRPRKLSIIPITRMNQDYEYLPNTFEEFESFATDVDRGKYLWMEKRAINAADNIVINGEGALTRNTNSSTSNGRYRARTRYMLFLAYYAAKYLGKKVSIVNHCVDPGDKTIFHMVDKVYPLLENCWVRDRLSLQNLELRGYTSAKYVPDALYNYEHKQSDELGSSDKPIVLSDTATLGYANWDIETVYEEIIKKVRSHGREVLFVDGNMWRTTDRIEAMCHRLNCPWIHVDNTSWQMLSQYLAQSSVFFSGRWHASILSTIVGTRSLLFGTDSHKTKALHVDLGLTDPFYEVDDIPFHIDQIVETLVADSQMNNELIAFSSYQRQMLRETYSHL